MTAIIVCNGSIRDYTYYEKYFKKADAVICADGGAMHLIKFGITPTILLGDFDSISHESLEFFRESGTEIIEFPREKDMTDTELAVELAIEKGFKTIIVIGGMGTRIDHSLANILLLRKMSNAGVCGYIVDEQNEITVISDKIRLQKVEKAVLTLLPLSEKVTGVTTKGLYYPLNEAVIEMGSTWGVSNEFVEDVAEVAIKTGLLMVIKSKD